jgi:hypothetical protein
MQHTLSDELVVKRSGLCEEMFLKLREFAGLTYLVKSCDDLCIEGLTKLPGCFLGRKHNSDMHVGNKIWKLFTNAGCHQLMAEEAIGRLDNYKHGMLSTKRNYFAVTVKNTLSTTEEETKQLTEKIASSALNTNVCPPHRMQSKKSKAKTVQLVMSQGASRQRKKRRNSRRPLHELVDQGKMNQTSFTDETW